ncbi:Stp1/IreP family PP2C-type Ser/Thr phosphatase [bacterium]|nr:MAG: Stp1/IreP family PP2C-type Ser/Thr phosphatase [bacterium]
MEDTTAEYAADTLAPAAELRFRPRVTLAAKTDIGRVREHNEDKFEFFMPEDERTLAQRGQIFLVCDGMGGHAAGQIAAELAIKTFIDVYVRHSAEDPREAMESAVRAANRYIIDNARAYPPRRGMGCTLSALILLQDAAWTVQVGDSRVYRVRDGALKRLTNDHSFVEEAVRMGLLTAEEAEVHPRKNVLTRAVGVEEPLVPDIDRHDLQAGDSYLLCSDGLTNHVNDSQIEEVMKTLPPVLAAWQLIARALQGGGLDNATALIVRVDEVEALG